MNKIKHRIFQATGALLIGALVLQSVFGALPAHAAIPTAPQQDTIYAPYVSAGPSSAIVISSPKADSLVAGSFVFAAQPLNSRGVFAVDFFSGNTLLGSDDSPEDGFSLELDSNKIPNGTVTLRAVAHGTRDSSAQIKVTNVQNPPQSTKANQSGAATAASETGSVIMVPPGGLPSGATLSVEEKSQEEVSSEFGIEWEDLGVTFLGAQQVDTSAPMAKPAAVSSAGFANRVQPGQMVVNYNIAPDADGDGIAEIVVVNTARVANDDIISDPLPEVHVGEGAVGGQSQGLAYAAQNGLHGAPGTMIEFDVSGFNPYSPTGNVARFKSAVDGKEFEMPALIVVDNVDPNRQLFSTQIPLLKPGAATVTLVNLTTTDTSAPIDITVDASPPLDRPALEIVDEYLALSADYINATAGDFPSVEDQLKAMATQLTDLRAQYAELGEDTSPEVQQNITDLATLINGSGLLEQLKEFAASGVEPASGPFTVNPAATAGTSAACFKPHNRFVLRMMNVVLGGLTVLSCALAFTGVGAVVCGALFTGFFAGAEVAQSTIPDCPPPPPCPPGGGSSNTTGMGSAPPPGGNICGGGGGGGGGNGGGGGGGGDNPQAATVAATTAYSTTAELFGQAMGRIKVFVVSDGQRTPFTGSIDRGGYYFLPFVPEGKPFVAYAIDVDSGEVRSYEGVGPKTGESLHISFNFATGSNAALENRWTGGGDGTRWSDPQNWSLGRVPGPVDKVVINVQANPTITINDNVVINSLDSAEALTLQGGSLQIVTTSSMSGKLTVQGGILIVNGTLTLDQPLDWTAGEIKGDGKLILNGGAALSGNSSKTLISLTVDNAGTLALGGTGAVLGGVGAVFNNLSGATLEIASQGGFQGDYFSGRTVFNNSGTIRKVGTNTSSLEATLNNQGSLIDVQGGTLELRDGGTLQGGTLTAADGAFLDFASGIYTMTGTLTGSGAGQVRAAGATLTNASAATLNFPNGGFGFTAGQFDGGTFTLQGKFLVSSNTSKTITGVTLNNEGLFQITGTADVLGGGGATFNNQSGATFEFASEAGYQGDYFSGRTVFNNSGTIRKTSTGLSRLQAIFNNQGTVEVQAGTLEMHDGGSIDGGTLTAADGAFLDFNSGTYTMTGSIAGSGAGQVRGTGATFTGSGTATLNFPNGGFGLTAGGFDNGGTFTLQGKFLVSGDTSKSIIGVTINNEGLFQIAGTVDILGGGGATFNNKSGATFEFASKAGYQGSYFSGGTTFNNSGTIRKTGIGLSPFHAIFNNQSGTIEVQAGTLELHDGGSIDGGTFTVESGAFLDFNSNDYKLKGTISGAGAGEVRVTGANFKPDTSATVNLTGGGFVMTAGTLKGPGTLTFQGKVTLSGFQGKTITGVTINNEAVWTWIGPGDILGGGGAVFNNQSGATFDARTDGDDIVYAGHYFSGGTTFNNSGSVIKSGDSSTATLQVCYTGNAATGVTVDTTGCP